MSYQGLDASPSQLVLPLNMILGSLDCGSIVPIEDRHSRSFGISFGTNEPLWSRPQNQRLMTHQCFVQF